MNMARFAAWGFTTAFVTADVESEGDVNLMQAIKVEEGRMFAL